MFGHLEVAILHYCCDLELQGILAADCSTWQDVLRSKNGIQGHTFPMILFLKIRSTPLTEPGVLALTGHRRPAFQLYGPHAPLHVISSSSFALSLMKSWNREARFLSSDQEGMRASEDIMTASHSVRRRLNHPSRQQFDPFGHCRWFNWALTSTASHNADAAIIYAVMVGLGGRSPPEPPSCKAM